MLAGMLPVVAVLAVVSPAYGLTQTEAQQFTHSSMCTPTGNVEQAYISSTYRMKTGVTVISTNHLPNHVWECVNPNSPKATASTYRFTSATLQTNDANVYCLPMGPIGIAKNGVYIYNPLTSSAKNAYTEELMDCNGGHSDQNGCYHYHSLPDNDYVYDSTDGSSQFIGVAFDGVPIYSQGNGISESDLDICRGMYVGGQYRYIASVGTFPYFIGCFRATPQISSVSSSQTCSGMSKGSLCSCQHGIVNFSKKRSLLEVLQREAGTKRSTCGTTYCGDGSLVTCSKRRDVGDDLVKKLLDLLSY